MSPEDTLRLMAEAHIQMGDVIQAGVVSSEEDTPGGVGSIA